MRWIILALLPTLGSCTDAVRELGGGPGGACEMAADGTACDDGDPCTTDDACEAGACVGTSLDCAVDGACEVGFCDPDTGQCAVRAAADGTRCEDGDLCTRGDACRAGACEPGEPLTCDGSTTCVIGVCDPATGECEGEPVEDGTACENECVIDAMCRSGECTGIERLCPSSTPCRDFLGCDPVAGCLYDVRPDGETCDDGDLCSLATECSAGECAATERVECPLEACMAANACNPATGGCEPAYLPDGSACDDGNLCTEGETCFARRCQGGEKVVWTGTPCSEGICFEDATTAAGLDAAAVGITHHDWSGLAVADLDGDGWVDVLSADEVFGAFDAFRGDGAGGFTRVTDTWALDPITTSTSAIQGFALGDYDADGDLDVYVLYNGPNLLLRNDGAGAFTDVTDDAGVGDGRWSRGAAFGDFDADGDLDLAVGNYIPPLGSFFPNHIPVPNALYQNDGAGRFTNVAAARGVEGQGTTSSIVFSDVDQDADLDLVVCNDFGPSVHGNEIFENDGKGDFVDATARFSPDLEQYCNGFATADWDRDTDLDYYFSALGRNALLTSSVAVGRAAFTEEAERLGLGLENDACIPDALANSYGAVFDDFDQDGWTDLYVSHGFILADPTIFNPLEQRNRLFRHRGLGQTFLEISFSARVADDAESRGAVGADYDGDGDVDLFVKQLEGGLRLHRNVSPSIGRWLIVELAGTTSNPFAPGAQIEADFGPFATVREYGSQTSYGSASPPEVHFGAGTATVAEALVVRWPSGIEQQVFDVPTDARVRLVEAGVVITRGIIVGAMAPGASIEARLEYDNVTPSALSFEFSVQLFQPDGTVVREATGTQLVDGLRGGSVQPTLTLPDPLPPGVVWRFTVTDENGGVDQE